MFPVTGGGVSAVARIGAARAAAIDSVSKDLRIEISLGVGNKWVTPCRIASLVPSGNELFYKSFFPSGTAPGTQLVRAHHGPARRWCMALRYLCTMIDPKFFDELRSRI